MIAGLLHTLVAVLLIVGYIVLSALGHDGTPLLTALGGQALGGGADAVAVKVNGRLNHNRNG